ncbi:MAG: hypothetical protein ACK4GT_22545, partial [Pararhodobacter sp.]
MRNVCIALCAAVWALPAPAQDFQPALEAYFNRDLRALATDPELVAAARAQNAVTIGYTADRIAALDRDWMAQVGAASRPLIEPILNNPISDLLRGHQAASGGRITEIFLMDAVGLNVAMSGVTSDYWQGDEEKHSETFMVGPDAVHYGAVEFDESAGSYQAQISFTVVDPATG